MGSSTAALRHYQGAAASRAAADTAPQKLIDMLLAGALDRIATAKGALLRAEVATKVANISAAIAIVDHLRLCLDHKAGGEVAANLEALYEYIGRRLVRANAANDRAALDECADLLRTIRSAWENLPMQEPVRH